MVLDLGDCVHEFSFTKFGSAVDAQFRRESLELCDTKAGQIGTRVRPIGANSEVSH